MRRPVIIGCAALGGVVAVAVIVAVVGTLLSPDTGSGAPTVRSNPAPSTLTLAQVEQLAHVDVPADTKLVTSDYQKGIDWHLQAKLTFARPRLAGFLTASSFPAPTPGLRTIRGDSPDDPQWRPDKVTEVAGVDQTSEPLDGVYRKLLLDQSDPTTVTVYLVAFTT